jgi:hypothetical protein
MSTLGNQPSFGDHVMLDTIVTDGSTGYTLQVNSSSVTQYKAEQLLVSVNGTIQRAGTSYTVNGSTITFASALASSDSIDFILALGSAHNAATVSDGAITAAKMASSIGVTATPVRINSNSIDSNITVGASQNAFVAGPISVNSEIVVNGSFTVV